MDKKKGLGKNFRDVLSSPADWMFGEGLHVFFCPIENLEPNPAQPRIIKEDSELDELTASISEKGVLQPIIVTKSEKKDVYTIVAGERRWRAAMKAGLKEVPVILKELAPSEVLELALIENIQRKDLSCIEEALAYQKLQEEFGFSQEEIAKKVGKSRSSIANTLRLLSLPDAIKKDVLEGRISMGHARVLLSIESEEMMFKVRDEIVQKGLSVREVEKRVYKKKTQKEVKFSSFKELSSVEDFVKNILGFKVRVKKYRKKGAQVSFFFESQEEVEYFIELLKASTLTRGGGDEKNSSH